MSNKPSQGGGNSIARIKEKQAAKKAAPAVPEQQPAHQPTLQAMVWYKEEHYAPLLEIFDDAERLPPTYEAWLQRAEEMKAKVEAEGDQVMKVFIEPESFTEWCEKKDVKKDAEARSQLAIEVAQSRSFSL